MNSIRALSQPMESSTNPIQFVSCTGKEEDVVRLRSHPGLLGIYQVCGRHPWLLEVLPFAETEDSRAGLEASGQILKPLDLGNLRPGPSSYAWKTYSWEDAMTRLDEAERRLQVFVFARPALENYPDVMTVNLRVEAFTETIKKAAASQPRQLFPRRLSVLSASDWSILLELLVFSIGDLSQLLYTLSEWDFRTSTKCVLTRWKASGETNAYYAYNQRRRSEFFYTPALPADFKLAMRARNDRHFFDNKGHDVQRRLLLEAQDRGIPPKNPKFPSDVDAQLGYSPGGHYVRAGQLKHANSFVEPGDDPPVRRLGNELDSAPFGTRLQARSRRPIEGVRGAA